MWLYLTKVLVSAAVIVAATEIARRSSFWAAVLVSLPLTSLLAFVWLRVDGAGPEQIARLAVSTFWLVLPSLVLFVVLPLLLRAGLSFWASLGIACAATAASYGAMVWLLGRLGVTL
jgi:hypothetical protein